MKKEIIALLFFIFAMGSAFAAKNPHDSLVLILTRNGVTQSIPILSADYNFNKLSYDTLFKKTQLTITLNHVNRFLLEAVSGDTNNVVDGVINWYNSAKKLKESIRIKKAIVYMISQNMGAEGESDNTVMLGFITDDFAIDDTQL